MGSGKEFWVLLEVGVRRGSVRDLGVEIVGAFVPLTGDCCVYVLFICLLISIRRSSSGVGAIRAQWWVRMERCGPIRRTSR